MAQSQVVSSSGGNTQALDTASRLLQGPVSSGGLCLLSLDGGGVRGLSTLMILRYLMAKINSSLPPSQRKKPFEVFDMIGGTSTGGLIAIMLGRLKMDVQECIELYNSMFKEIFGSPIHKFPVTVALQIQSQFDSAILRRCITKIVGESKSLAENDLKAIATAKSSQGTQKARDALIEVAAAKVLLDDGVARGCHTFVCATTVEDQRTVRFRDYPRSDLGILNNTSIVDAACATSAATSYFDAVNVNGRLYRDGGFGANNPVTEVWHEAREVWIKDDYDVQLDDILKCFVSIGTGFPKTEGMKEGVKGFIDTLKNMVTQTKRSADDFMKNNRNLTKIDGSQRYFRFNVEQGLQDVGLEEWKKANLIESATEGYMESPERENLVALCANNLRLKTTITRTDFIEEVKRYKAFVRREKDRLLLQTLEEQVKDIDIETTPAVLTLEVLTSWLKPDLSYLDYHLSVRGKQIDSEAGRWVFENNHFREWREKLGSRFWLHGKVGSGKTILCSSIIELLKTQVGDDSNIAYPVLFFYFSFNNSEQQKLESFLIAIFYQLCVSQGVPKQLQVLYTKFRDMARGYQTVPLPRRKDLEETFQSVVQSLSGGSYLVMDALDEIPHGDQRKDFLEFLRSISGLVNSKLSVLVTSQGEPDFREEFQWDSGWRILGMGSSRVDVDIGRFVQNELARKFARLSDTNRDKIKDYLVEHANGTFRWVDLILQMLQIPRVLRPTEIDEILHSLPKDLIAIYDKLLSRVDQSVSQEVAVALQWLSLSKRPLFIEEVLEGVIVNPDTSPIYNPDRLLNANDLLSCLTGLITIEPEVPTDEQIQVERHIVALAHSSVRDYLTSPNSRNSAAIGRYRFEQKIAHEFIARSCVEYLIRCKLVSWVNNNYPLAKYSDHYWTQHADHVPGLALILRRRLSKMWSPILYPEIGSIPMLLANESDEIKGNFVNASAIPKYESLERRVESFSNTLDDNLYNPLDNTMSEFRLLVLLSSKAWDNPIECRLQVVSLNEIPYFCAISHVWGNPQDPPRIIVDGVHTQVTSNLECALRYLRQAQAGYHQVLWVDAICINQADQKEKEFQIAIMPEIFRSAEKVILWLGAEDWSSRLAMRFLSGIQDIPNAPDSVRNGLMSMSADTWSALQFLFDRPWFSRLWVISEVAVAKEIEIFCGNQSIPWSVLERIEEAYALHGPELLNYTFKFRNIDVDTVDNPRRPERALTFSIFGSARMTTVVAIRRRLKSGLPYSLLDLLVMTRYHLTTDPRDRIFALLPLDNGVLAHHQFHQMPFPIDYNIAIEHTYVSFGAYLLRRSRNLDLLSFAGVGVASFGSEFHSEFPTWVPDLRNLKITSLDPGIASQPFARHFRRLYNATSTSFASPEFSYDYTELNLSGIYVGIINMVCHHWSDLTDLTTLIDQLLQWKGSMKIPVVLNRYEEEPENQVFLRTLLADQDFNNSTGSSRLNWKRKEIRDDDMHQILKSHIQALQYSLDGRTFMTAENGYVGLCPEHAQHGDQIVLFHGGRMPYVIRPRYNSDQELTGYILIGEAYVHGIMDGELVNKKHNLLKLFRKSPPVVRISLV